MFMGSMQSSAKAPVLFSCVWTQSALWDKWNELNHQGDCSQAIDFMGHQITLGLAEHMPFSTRRKLSFSQINSSNYPRSTHRNEFRNYSTIFIGLEWGNTVLLIARHQINSLRRKYTFTDSWSFQSTTLMSGTLWLKSISVSTSFY